MSNTDEFIDPKDPDHHEIKSGAKQKAEDQPVKAVLFIIGAIFVFAIVNTLVKWLGERGYTVPQIIFFRSVFGMLPVLPWLMKEGGLKALPTKFPLRMGIRALSGGIAMLLLFYAITVLPLPDMTALSFTYVLFVVPLSIPILHEKVGLHRWLAVLIGFGGVLLIAQPTGNVTLFGVAACLAATFLQAIAMIMVRMLNRTDPGVRIILYHSGFSALLGASLMMFFWTPLALIDIAFLIALGLIAGVGQIFLTNAFRYGPAGLVSPFQYTSIVWGVLFGILIFDEYPRMLTMIGSGIVIASGLYIFWREQQLARQK